MHSLATGAVRLAHFIVRYAWKPAIWAVIVYAIAYWVDDFDGRLGPEFVHLATKVGVLAASVIHQDHVIGAFDALIGAEALSWLSVARVLAGASLLVLGLALTLSLIAFLPGLARFRVPLPRGARFAFRREVAKTQSRDGMSFGHYGGRPLMLSTDKHIYIQASSRSGKGVVLIIPHLLRYCGSAFVLDPKGENAKATGRRRAELNKVVHYLDPFGISDKPRSRFNPLSRITPETMDADSKALGAALIFRTRDHWIGAAQQLLAAVIVYVLTDPEIPAAKKDLVTVRRLLLGFAKETLEAMTHSKVFGGTLAAQATSFLATPEKELGSIISAAQRETEILDNPQIAACLAGEGEEPEVDFSEWHRSTMTVYLCLAAPRFPEFSGWLRLVLTAALSEMTHKLNPPPRPVCFMLDELATLGRLAAVESAIGLTAGYGVQLVTVWQDLAQLRDLYQARAGTFIGNSGVRAIFNLSDLETARYWSEFIGTSTVQTHSESRDSFGIKRGETFSDQQQPLITPAEMMLRYSSDKMLVLKEGLPPIETERVPYWKDHRLDGLWDDPRAAPVSAAAAE